MAEWVEGVLHHMLTADPNVWDKKHDEHVLKFQKRGRILKAKWDTPLRPHGFWKTGQFNTWHNRHEKQPGRRYNGFVPVGIDKNGNPLSANSCDSYLAQIDAMYEREMAYEEELAEARKASV